MDDQLEPIHPGPWGEFPDRYWSTYFGDEATYYMAELGRLRTGQSLDFRWAAFFLSMLWMVYRRMYVIAACAMGLVLLESTLEEALYALLAPGELAQSVFELLISLAVNTAMGYYANRVYLWDARRNIRQVLVELPHAHEAEVLAAIARRGGSSMGAVLVFLALSVVAGIALTYGLSSFFTLW